MALLRKKFDKHLDLFEMYSLRNIFRVPADVHVCSVRASATAASLSPDNLVCPDLTDELRARHIADARYIVHRRAGA